jgi:pyruvate,water dikinase
MMVTVDADYANVYAGVVEELVQRRQSGGSLEVSPIVRQLQDILQHVTPLNLTDPRSPKFSPRGCRTLHDITRFCHEAALKEMFELSKESHFTARSARRLVADVPLQWWVIDLQDGLKGPPAGKTVRVDQVTSIPLQALWKGMTAQPWKGPPPVDTKGFMSVMMKGMTDPGRDPAVHSSFVDKNYMLVARNFCNVSVRLGFHFSTVESYIADKADQNYVSFVFTGGGGDDGRKERRVELISRLVELADFRVEVRGASLFARIEGNSADFTCKRLRVIGHIMVHTRQMDMVMYNDKMVDFYYKDFARAILPYFEPNPEVADAG